MGTVGAARAAALHWHGWCNESSGFSELFMDTDGVKGAMGTGDVYLMPRPVASFSDDHGEGPHREAMHAGGTLSLYTVAGYEALGLLMGIRPWSLLLLRIGLE